MHRLIVVMAVVLVCGSPASAQFLEQFEESRWVVQASLTPEWQSTDVVRDVFGLDRFDLSWSDFMVGFARGRSTTIACCETLPHRRHTGGATADRGIGRLGVRCGDLDQPAGRGAAPIYGPYAAV